MSRIFNIVGYFFEDVSSTSYTTFSQRITFSKKINRFWNIKNICKECLFLLFGHVRDQVLCSTAVTSNL